MNLLGNHKNSANSWRETYRRVALRGATRSPEGRILLIGIVLAFLYMASLSVCVLFYPAIAQKFIAVTATNVLFGRAAGMSMGYAFGFGHAVVIPMNMIIETILVLLFYPLFVFSLSQLLVSNWLRKFLNRTLTAAKQHHQKVRRYGILGLALFVWFPFTMTGPMVGCIIGYLLGLRPWVNMSVVLGSTYLAVVAWAMLLRDALERFAAYSPYAPIVVVVLFISLYVLYRIIRAIREKRQGK